MGINFCIIQHYIQIALFLWFSLNHNDVRHQNIIISSLFTGWQGITRNSTSRTHHHHHDRIIFTPHPWRLRHPSPCSGFKPTPYLWYEYLTGYRMAIPPRAGIISGFYNHTMNHWYSSDILCEPCAPWKTTYRNTKNEAKSAFPLFLFLK